MLVHSVYFWLRNDLSAEDKKTFVAGLESLRGVKTVKQLFIGTPAPLAPRPVVDSTYSYALTIVFDDEAGHDSYQVDPIHQAFVADNKTKWTRVQIYDAA
ncbi:MAG: Dabb family protein [Opitutaceae bacterium]|nr:Dabb family protein [Opitutaceae bacterium]